MTFDIVVPAKARGLRSTRRVVLCVFTALVAASAAAAADVRDDAASCRELRQIASVETSSAADAIRLVGGAVDRVGAGCAGEILLDLAKGASLEAHLADVSDLADSSLKHFESAYGSEDPVLLRPLALAAAANFQLNNWGKSKRLIDRMRQIRPRTPDQRALVHTLAARVLRAEGKLDEAEAEMRTAVLDQEAAGQFKSADQVWILHELACIYIEQGRYDSARATVDRTRAVLDTARDTVPLDRLRLFELGGLVAAREGKWSESERQFAQSLAIADQTPSLEPSITRALLSNYVVVMKKAGHGKAAKLVEKRLAELPANVSGTAIVDVSQLEREGRQ